VTPTTFAAEEIDNVLAGVLYNPRALFIDGSGRRVMCQSKTTVREIFGGLTLGQLWSVIGIVFAVISGTFTLGAKYGPLLTIPGYQKAVLTETIKDDPAAQGVVAFLNVEKDPDAEAQVEKDYQRIGYSADLTQLRNLIHQFLVNASKTPYPDAQNFYTDMDLATGLVIRRAKNTFASPGDKIEAKADYNWNVYGIPSLFRIFLAELKKAHATGLSGEQVDSFQREFDQWRSSAPQ
jgi:hypothetical protein